MGNSILRLRNTSTTVQSNSEESYTYRDIDMYAPDRVIETRDDIVSIQSSLHNIFSWRKGERVLDPEFGVNLRQFLYNGINENTSDLITSEIKAVLDKYEPRIVVNYCQLVNTDNNTDNNELKLEIHYTTLMDTSTEYTHLTYI